MSSDEEVGRKIYEAFDNGATLIILTMVNGKLSATVKGAALKKNRERAKPGMKDNALLFEPREWPNSTRGDQFSLGRIRKKNLLLSYLELVLQELSNLPQMHRVLGGTTSRIINENSIAIRFPHARDPLYVTIADAPNARVAREKVRRSRRHLLRAAEQKAKISKEVREEERLQNPDYRKVIEDARKDIWARRKRNDV